jgi:hypothetical protein
MQSIFRLSVLAASGPVRKPSVPERLSKEGFFMRAPIGRLAGAIGVLVTAGAVALATAGQAGAAPSGTDAETSAPAGTVSSAAGSLTSTVTGSFTDASGGVGSVTGTFVPQSFTSNGSQVLATGVLTGTLVDSAGNTVGTASQTVTTPVTGATADGTGSAAAAALSCQVLDLNLAPLDLNLLGLVVHLDRVHLNITAVPGAGNLLGNLLCAVVGLLDGGQFGNLATILNQILALLNLLG